MKAEKDQRIGSIIIRKNAQLIYTVPVWNMAIGGRIPISFCKTKVNDVYLHNEMDEYMIDKIEFDYINKHANQGLIRANQSHYLPGLLYDQGP